MTASIDEPADSTGSAATRSSGNHPYRGRRLIVGGVALAGLVAFVVFVIINQSPTATSPEQQETATVPEVDVTSLSPTAANEIAELRRGVSDHPDSAIRWGRLGMMLRAYNFERESNVCFREAARLDSSDYRWPYLLGVTLAIRDAAAAEDAFRRAIEANGAVPEPRLRLAELLLKQNKTASAERQFRAVRALQGIDAGHRARALLGLARIELQSNQVENCRRYAEESAALVPGQRATHELLANVYHRLDRTRDAERQVAILRQLPDRPTNWPDPLVGFLIELRKDANWKAAQAQQLLRRGNAAAAIDLLSQVVRSHPDDSGFHVELVRALLADGRFADAARELARAERRHPNVSELRRLHGELEFARKNYAAAAAQFRESIARKRDHAQAWARLGDCYVRLKKTDSAIDAFQTALSIDPALWKVYLTLAEQQIINNSPADAIRSLRAASGLRPTDETIKKRLNALLSRHGR